MTDDLKPILATLQRLRGIDFSNYRSNTLTRRISARLYQLGFNDYAAYLERLENDPTECDQLIDVIAINVSSFFRDPIVWEMLNQRILPALIEKKSQKGVREIRAWSAGCAAGEEIYSLAILIEQALKKNNSTWVTSLFATDIDRKALDRAAKALYTREYLADTKLGILDKYFKPAAESFKLSSAISSRVSFSRDDLTAEQTDSPAESVYGEFDLILCRNTLIYFNRELQNRVMHKFSRALAPGGYLILGSSESLSDEIVPRFRAVDSRNHIYQKTL
jgi:chemotaxis protein methyltransferase CheR